MLEVAAAFLLGAAIVACAEAWTWRRRAQEWQRTARETAALAEQVIRTHAPDDDELLEARAELRRIREGAR